MTGTAVVSDAVIAIEIGRGRRAVIALRESLRDKGILAWRRTGGKNVYFFNFGLAAPVIDHMNKVKTLGVRCATLTTHPMCNSLLHIIPLLPAKRSKKREEEKKEAS